MSTTPRYAALDILRGIAILGTLGTNIWIFTNAEGLVGYINGTGRATGQWSFVQDVLQQVTQGKFLGLLTIMFGIGLAIQHRSAAGRGLPWPGKYPWRAALLMIDGVLHYFLFTEFDVLTGYAITGLVVAFVLSTGVQSQRIWIACALALHAAMLAVATAALAALPPNPGNRTLSPNPYADGTFWDLVVFRAENFALFRLETIFILPLSIALFLIGARLFAGGILDPGRARLRRTLMIVGFGGALPLDFALGLFGSDAGLVLGRYGTAPIVAFALLAAVAQRYADGRAPGSIGSALAPVGRMALSCYILQNVLCSIVCYGWGLGLASRLDGSTIVPATVALFAAVSATLMVVARLWLTRFERGPVEWLWNVSYQALAGGSDSPASAAVPPPVSVSRADR
ncbi:DUF418 domain-containing protein [Rhodococcus coprophilus]|uniref:Predicted membrane protein n=1 Tax=Rhodococcus coprophilus TaxID=38310 RepID=A0A2X4XCV6_9NOCA|nr:DUF418 domain-containing protein [Rhodococcus coprophilus]MBM7459900.1 uncharacterized protein [Rhodococcus coprophilus]SQI37655.1 Predicted membrane protein [Rhodococcus coprophilus]